MYRVTPEVELLSSAHTIHTPQNVANCILNRFEARLLLAANYPGQFDAERSMIEVAKMYIMQAGYNSDNILMAATPSDIENTISERLFVRKGLEETCNSWASITRILTPSLLCKPSFLTILSLIVGLGLLVSTASRLI